MKNPIPIIKRRLLFAIALLSCQLHAPFCLAEEQLQPHFSFSSYFGSGLYNHSGTDVTVFNIPLVFSPDWEGIKRLQNVRLRTPVSIGFTNFDYKNVGETQLDHDTATLSLAVGLEKDYWDSKRLKFVPFIDVGYAEDFSSNKGAFLYAFGTSIFRYTKFWNAPQILYGKIQHAGYAPLGRDNPENYTSFQLGADVKVADKIPLGRLSSFVSIYGSAYYYLVGLNLEQADLDAIHDQWVYELGFTWGLDKAIETAVSDIERIGLGYRFSHKNNGLWHITFNFPLD